MNQPYRTSPSSTPCRSLPEWRGVLFRRWAGLGLGLPAVAMLLAGCDLWPDNPPPPRRAAVKPTPRPAVKSKDGKPQITSETLRAWLDRWMNPAKRTAVAMRPTVIYIDTEAVARRHPAWELADALQNGVAPAPARVIPIAVPSTVSPPPETAPAAPVTARRTLPPITIAVRGNEQSQRRQQTATTERFLADFSRRDAARLADVQRWALQFLEDEVANARRQALSELDPNLLPPDVQLQLTNLRLEQAIAALPASRKTQPEKAAINARIREIETRWQNILRAQEAEQVEKFNIAMNDVPERVRRAGQERIQRLTTRIRTDRATSREAVREEQSTLLANDFAPGTLDLSLRLPAANIVSSRTIPAPPGQRAQISKTSGAGLPSAVQLEENGALTVPKTNATQAQIKRLHDLARSDARDWARLAALSLGGRWSSSPGHPNRTQQALELLVGEKRSGGDRAG